MKKSIFIVSVLLTTLSCTNKTKDTKEVVSAIAADNEDPTVLAARVKQLEAEEKAKKEAELANRTSLSFEKLVHDFGNVKPDSDNSYKFKVTNTGKKPLIIEKVSASCGCTTPHKPEQPILPGQSDFIEVGFHPKPGQTNEISKTVTVEANTDPKITELQIKAFVK